MKTLVGRAGVGLVNQMYFSILHGFWTRDRGKRAIDRFAAPLRAAGHFVDTDSMDYGWHGLLMVRLFHGKAVNRIVNALRHTRILITHSNGQNYGFKALWKAAKLYPNKKYFVFAFSPALDSDAEIPPNVEHMWVFATPHDKAVRVAKWLRWHPWGDMGRVGYTGPNTNVTTLIRPDIKGHSEWAKRPGYFAKLMLALLADYMHKDLEVIT